LTLDGQYGKTRYKYSVSNMDTHLISRMSSVRCQGHCGAAAQRSSAGLLISNGELLSPTVASMLDSASDRVIVVDAEAGPPYFVPMSLYGWVSGHY
jgi:hypothetical protein